LLIRNKKYEILSLIKYKCSACNSVAILRYSIAT
jgi:hypothetical protein